ncbi:Zinc finger CCHC domain-containing protein 3 [Holothuria leucospilota]|uniref:Zinc finger CCHC domain-containing protein 3 n=1 Tax=Holothuria leucospilota TaxID=206669 RepID=A0A9Q1C2P2_HOLLE|nr:Zinc finger CCHC domain-containing protein 3 [Holothuria leucospilota]
MPVCWDSSIVKLEFSSVANVTPSQVFSLLKKNGVGVEEIEMLQALEARNTYDLKFRSYKALMEIVSSLEAVEGLTVTPYDRSVVVTVLYLNFEVEQGLVARVLGQYGTVSDMRWCTYGAGEMRGILNGKRQFRMVLKKDIPSFLFIGGSKAYIRYLGQRRTCFKCGVEEHEAKSCPNRRCGKCLQLGHGKPECPNKVRCNLCGEEGHVFGDCPTSYSACASDDVEFAPEPSQTGPEYTTQELEEAADEVEQDFLASKQCEGGSGGSPPSLKTAPGEVELMTVEEDLHLTSDSESVSAMSDGGGPASEHPPKDAPSGEGWFDLGEGEGRSQCLRARPLEGGQTRGPVILGNPYRGPEFSSCEWFWFLCCTSVPFFFGFSVLFVPVCGCRV